MPVLLGQVQDRLAAAPDPAADKNIVQDGWLACDVVAGGSVKTALTSSS